MNGGEWGGQREVVSGGHPPLRYCLSPSVLLDLRLLPRLWRCTQTSTSTMKFHLSFLLILWSNLTDLDRCSDPSLDSTWHLQMAAQLELDAFIWLLRLITSLVYSLSEKNAVGFAQAGHRTLVATVEEMEDERQGSWAEWEGWPRVDVILKQEEWGKKKKQGRHV